MRSVAVAATRATATACRAAARSFASDAPQTTSARPAAPPTDAYYQGKDRIAATGFTKFKQSAWRGRPRLEHRAAGCAWRTALAHRRSASPS